MFPGSYEPELSFTPPWASSLMGKMMTSHAFFLVGHPMFRQKTKATSFAPQVFNMIDILEAIRGDVGPHDGSLYKSSIN